MDGILETLPALAPHCALGRVGSDPVGAQVLREESAPLSQCGFPDVETPPILAHRPDDQVHMRMILVRMHGQDVAMLEGELLARSPGSRGAASRAGSPSASRG